MAQRPAPPPGRTDQDQRGARRVPRTRTEGGDEGTWCAAYALVAGLVAVLGAGLLALGAAAPAHAEPCTGSEGVTVVVERGPLGGGTSQGCDTAAAGEKSAADITTSAGYELTPVQGEPAVVCRIAGQPADRSCTSMPPGDAYWALYWTDGSADWGYAQKGANQFTPPEGSTIAWVWQDGAQTLPSTSPTTSAPDGTATSSPAAPEASTTASGQQDRDNEAAASDSDSGAGVPVWLVVAVVVVLLAVALAATLLRRRRT